MEKYKQTCKLRTEKLLSMGIGQEELQKMLNASPLTVSRWFSGNRVPKIEDLLTLAIITRTNIEYLLCLSEENTCIERYDINLRLRKLRTENNLSQAKLARMMGTSQRLIDIYELNGKPSSLNTLMNFANFFCVSLDYMLGLTDYYNWRDNEKEESPFDRMEIGSAFHIENENYDLNCMLVMANGSRKIVLPNGKMKPVNDKSFENIIIKDATIIEREFGNHRRVYERKGFDHSIASDDGIIIL